MHTLVEVIKCEFGRPKRTLSPVNPDEPATKWTPLQYAAFSGREAALRHFLKSGQPDGSSTVGESPLCIATAAGRLPVVQILCDAGANVQAQIKSNGETAVHIAVRMGRNDILDILLSHKPSLEAKTTTTMETPLHYAAKAGSLSAVVTLLKHGASYEARNSDSRSPAEVAFQNNYIPVAVAIIGAARGTRALAKEKEMLLRYVEKSKNRFSLNNELIADIFEAGCDPKSTVLVEAVKRDDAGLVDMFLEKGADPNRPTARRLLPLLVAMDCSNAQIVLSLVKHGADASIKTSDGSTLLQVVLASPRRHDRDVIYKVCEALLLHGSDPLVKDSYQRTLLHHAVKHDKYLAKVAHILLECGVKVNDVDKNGCTALHLATNSKSCTDVLLKYGANPNLKNHDGDTPLLLAVSTDPSSTSQTDLESLIKVSDLAIRNKDHKTPLHLAAENGLEKAVMAMIKHKADTTVTDSTGSHPLLLAAKNRRWPVVRILASQPGVNQWDVTGKTALHYIAMSSPDPSLTWADVASAAKKFCERGVSRTMRDRSGATPLILATKTLDTSGQAVIEVLLSEPGPRPGKENCVNHEDHGQRSALYHAATMGKYEFVKLLLKGGAAMSLQNWASKGPLKPTDPAQKNVLALMASHEWRRRARMLKGSQMSTVLNIRDLKDLLWMGLDPTSLPGIESPLWATLFQYQSHGPSEHLNEVLYNLFDARANPNCLASLGQPKPLDAHPLVFLIELNLSSTLTQLLLNKGANPNARSSFHEGRSPLHAAVKIDRIDIVQLLLRHGADINALDSKSQTPLYIAASNGFVQVAELLIQRKAEVRARNHIGDTALHAAAANGSAGIVPVLLRAGARASITNKAGLTPSRIVKDKSPETEAIIKMLKIAENREHRNVERPSEQTQQHTEREREREGESLEKETRIREVESAKHPIERTPPPPYPQAKDVRKDKVPRRPNPAPLQQQSRSKSSDKSGSDSDLKSPKTPRVDSGFSLQILSNPFTKKNSSTPNLPGTHAPKPKHPSKHPLATPSKSATSLIPSGILGKKPEPPPKVPSLVTMNDSSFPHIRTGSGEHRPPVPPKANSSEKRHTHDKAKTGHGGHATAEDFSDWIAMSKILERM